MELTIENIRFDTGPVTDADGWEHNLWRFDLSVDGVGIYWNSPFRTGMALSEPSEGDILESILLDLQSIDGYADWLDWHCSFWGDGADADQLRRSRDAFSTIRTMRSLILENSTDPEAYEALMALDPEAVRATQELMAEVRPITDAAAERWYADN